MQRGIKCLSCTEKQEGPTLVTRKCGNEYHISLHSKVRRHRDTKRQSGLPNLLLALSVLTTSTYSNLGVLQGFEPPTSATNSVSLPLSHISWTDDRYALTWRNQLGYPAHTGLISPSVCLSIPLSVRNMKTRRIFR